MKVLDRRYEMMPRDELEQLQLERLQALLARLKRNVRRYRELLGDTRIESLADIARLPCTTPDGNRLSLYVWFPTTSVCPALCPP